MRLAFHEVDCARGDFRLELDFTIEGEAVGVFGASGAGKTTVLRLLTGALRPHAGTIEFNGATLWDSRRSVPPNERRFGYVPQESLLFPHLSVEKNLRFGGSDHETFDDVVELLELRTLLSRGARGLSGGEQRRVAIGRALMSAPRLLILDEPLTGLDARLEERVIAHLQQLRGRRRIPLVYVSHSAEQLAQLCDHAIVLEAGRVIRSGTIASLFERREVAQFTLRR